MVIEQKLIDLIKNTSFLSLGDKDFLLNNLSKMSPLEKLRLQSSLLAGQAPAVLQSLQILRAKFFTEENKDNEENKQEGLLDKISSVFSPKKTKKIVAHSILTQPHILGSQPPQAIKDQQVKVLNKLEEFYHPFQLVMLNSSHISFDLNTNSEQTIQAFLENLSQIFTSIENTDIKRGYFINYVQSSLFTSYINTGLTALRHPELQPSKVVLNLLYQINQSYLNNKQFQLASLITNHIRNLVGI